MPRTLRILDTHGARNPVCAAGRGRIVFDWDQDFDAVTASVPLPRAAVPAPAPASLRLHRLRPVLARFGAPVAVCLAVALGAVVVQAPGGAMAAQGGASPLLAAMGQWLPGAEPRMPDGLRAYDESQFAAFRRGIVRFSNAELLEFERTTLEGYNRAEPFLADFSHDVLVLTHQEITRRGLTRPVAVLRFDAPRTTQPARDAS